MSYELSILVTTAATIGFIHTLFGPDHYLPFIVMARARKWSYYKTILITVICGFGHVLSSVLLGFLGIAFGIAVLKLETIESFRGSIAAWALIAFGLTYFVWGLGQALKRKPHEHSHIHINRSDHLHTHDHTTEHVHVHGEKGTKSLTPWVLFTIFIFGPCEPLIPLLMYPAAKSSLSGVVLVTSIFGGVTILTMLGMVLISAFGISLIPTSRIEKYTHAIAGATILMCGISIQFLGL